MAAEIECTESELRSCGDADAGAVASRLAAARRAFADAVDFVLAHGRSDPNAAYAGSVPYLMLAGNLMAGWQLGRALLAALRCRASGDDVDFMKQKIAVARFYADHVLTRVPGLRDSIVDGASAVEAMPVDSL
jgi:hypothetical protein